MSNGRYTAEQLQAARVHAADCERRLIADLISGECKARDPKAWIAELEASIVEIESGLRDNNFTIRQRMHTFLTGECVPLLAPVKSETRL